MNHMVHLGRTALTSSASGTNNLIGALSSSAFLYEQVLALQACYGTRDPAQVFHILNSSTSKLLRKRALDVIVTIGSKSQVAQALHSLPHNGSRLQEHAVKHLGRLKRLDVVDEFLSSLWQSELQEEQLLFTKLLWTASARFLSEVLPSIFDKVETVDLVRLLRRHAEVVWVVVVKCPEVRGSSSEGDGAVRGPFLKILNALLRHTYSRCHVPDAIVWDLILDVLSCLLRRSVPFSTLYTSELERRRPCEVVKLVIERGIKDFKFKAELLQNATVEQLLVLQKLNPGTLTKDNFKLLKREQRIAVFQKMNILWRDSDGALPLAVVNALPFEDKMNEARKHIQFPAFETEPTKRIPYAALLPWDEAMLLQQPFIRSNNADIRSRALNTQIKAVTRQPSSLCSALNLLLNRRNEQDPVRYQCLLALAEVPVRMWREEHLDIITHITRDALNAPDLSRQSVYALLNVTTKILLCDSKWASAQLALIIGERQQAPPHIVLPSGSPVKDIMSDLGDALSPLLDKLLRTPENGGLVVSIIAALQVRDYLNYIPPLVEKLEWILENTNSLYLASSALNILFTSQPQRLPVLIPRLVHADPGWVAFQNIEKWMVKHNIIEYQDIPDSAGRFGVVRPTTRCIWPHSQPWKTTQVQQEKDFRRLLRIINSADNSVSDQQTSIKLSATLIYVDLAPLIHLASDSRPVVCETAIRVLGRLDAGQGIPALRALLLDSDQNHVRVAIYALRPALKSLTSHEAIGILRTVPMSKVTIAKEVIRIARDLNSESSYVFLREMTNKDPHRDVLIALLGALASDIARPDTFQFFQRAVQNPDPAVPLLIIDSLPQVDDCPEEKVLACWKQLLALLLKHPHAQVRDLALRRAGNWGVVDEEQILVPPISSLLDSQHLGESREAATALIRLYSVSHPKTVGDVFGRFVDRKEYNTLTQLVSVYCQQDEFVLVTAFETTNLVLEVLEMDRLTSCLRLEILFGAVPIWEELRIQIEELAPRLTADALVKAEGLVERLGDCGGGWFDIEVVERDLGASVYEQVRRLGLSALVARAKMIKGWTGELRERLELYRSDEAVLVAEAAVFVELLNVERNTE
jgi:hypothetical protein